MLRCLLKYRHWSITDWLGGGVGGHVSLKTLHFLYININLPSPLNLQNIFALDEKGDKKTPTWSLPS